MYESFNAYETFLSTYHHYYYYFLHHHHHYHHNNSLIITISPSYIITSFNTGSTSTIEIQLDHHIGELQQINIQNNGDDGWIFIDFTCQIKQILYQLEIKKPYQWLQNYNKNLELLYENGFNANSNQDDYLANDNMILNVKSHVFIYSSIGVIDDYTLH